MTYRRGPLEETGHALTAGPPLALVVTPPHDGRPARFGVIFDGGTLSPAQAARIRLDPHEHDDHRFATLTEWRRHLPADRHARLAAYEQARSTGTTAYLSELG